TRQIGAPFSCEHRVYIENAEGKEKTIMNMVVEIPRWTNAKLESKKGKLRFVRNVFPHHGYIWNYGAFPQTWEDPDHIHPDTKAKGDNDLSMFARLVKQVKVLGTMALLDEGETDWKIIAIDLKDIEDVEKYFPGLLRATNEWFRIYKIPDGKPENNFAFSGEAKNKAYATEVVAGDPNEAWKKMIMKSPSTSAEKHKLSIVNTQVENSPFKVDFSAEAYTAIPADAKKPANPIDPSIGKWFYLSAQPATFEYLQGSTIKFPISHQQKP
ncbi:inorganic pyrophosphatase, partial [Chytridium lagenaria]